MQIAILSARTGWHTDELLRALASRGHVGVILQYEKLMARIGGPAAGLTSEGAALLQADGVLARIIPSGSLEQIIFRVDALHWIEESGVPVVNSPRAIERAVDKFYTDALLRAAALQTPETIVCESVTDAMEAVRALGDVVIKPIFGSMGQGLIRASDPDVAFRVLKSLDQVRTVFYVQRFIEHDGRDIRAFVVGDRVIGAIERRAQPGEWRTNVAQGASTRPIGLPAAWEEIAVRAATAIGAGYAGVDLLEARDGRLYVLEVNAIPGWQGLQQATGIDVAGAVVDHLQLQVRSAVAGATERLA